MEAISFAETSDASTITTTKPALRSVRMEIVEEDFKDITPNKEVTTKEAITIKYTIKAGDDKRIDKNGVLKLYNINKPIEIPVVRLLGKWKRSHVGATLYRIDEEWKVEGSQIQPIVHEKKPSVSIVKRLMFRYRPANAVERLFNKGISDDNIFRNA